MNRVIQFRALTINGEQVIGLLLISQGKQGQPPAGYYISNSAGMPWAYQVRPETIGQFSGFSDRKGRPIYEGDVLCPWSESIGPYCIVFENGAFACYHKRGRWGLLSRVFEADILRDYTVEVIGNIHEHPDLLKTTQQSPPGTQNASIPLKDTP